MKSTYQLIYKHEGIGGLVRELGLTVFLAAEKQLSEEGGKEVQSLIDKVRAAIHRDLVLQNKEYMEGIANAKVELLACFPSDHIYVKEVENRYTKSSIEPWYEVTTKKGIVTIGWRKRVIEIVWEKDVNPQSAFELFPEEDVTRSTTYDNPHYIHAWGYEKAKEYLAKLLA